MASTGGHVAVLGHEADLHVAQVETGDGGLALELGARGVGQGVAVASDGGEGVDHHDGLELGTRRFGGGTKAGSLGDAVVKDYAEIDDVALGGSLVGEGGDGGHGGSCCGHGGATDQVPAADGFHGGSPV